MFTRLVIAISLATLSVGDVLDHKWKMFKEKFQCKADFELAKHAADEVNIPIKSAVNKPAHLISEQLQQSLDNVVNNGIANMMQPVRRKCILRVFANCKCFVLVNGRSG